MKLVKKLMVERVIFPFTFSITDHSPDHPETASPGMLRRLYADFRDDGISAIRNDWRWSRIEPVPKVYDLTQLQRYQMARQVMGEVGLSEPTIILSSIPGWARLLYHANKAPFFVAYREYAERVCDALGASDQGSKVERVQVLNELNHPYYTPISSSDVMKVFAITKEVFSQYNHNIKLVATVIASNMLENVARLGLAPRIKDVLGQLRNMNDCVAAVGIDYYPGYTHLPFKNGRWRCKDLFKDLSFLRALMEEMASWKDIASGHITYELDEVGYPTSWIGSERKQRYFFDVFFRSFKHMMLDFQQQGKPLPTHIGLYQAIDGPATRTRWSPIFKRIGFPEYSMGVHTSDGRKKPILQGNPRQLSRIIHYMQSPMQPK